MELNVSNACETSHKIRPDRHYGIKTRSSDSNQSTRQKEKRRILTNAPLKAIELNELLVNYWVTCTR
jgi:hypothetical protein